MDKKFGMPFTHLVAALALATAAMSCASKSDGDGAAASTNTTTVVTPTPIATPSPTPSTGVDYFAGQGGGSAVFVVDGGTSSMTLNSAQMNRLVQYVGNHPLNKPTNFRIQVDLTQPAGGRWGGTVRIGYIDNGKVNAGEFTTQNPSGYNYVRVSYNNYYKSVNNAEFNQWFTSGGKTYFHGFFQDGLGSIVIVIDKFSSGGYGDGTASQTVSGSIYFKNFKTAPAPQFMDVNGDGTIDGEMCWFLFSPSPYACGSFFSGGKVVTNSAIYPSSADGYVKLGTFSNLNRFDAFNQ